SHIFYFRRSVPRKLRPLIGLHEIKKSLKTKEWLVARPRFFFMQQKCEQLFMSIEKQHPYLPENEALAAVQEWANREIASWKPEQADGYQQHLHLTVDSPNPNKPPQEALETALDLIDIEQMEAVCRAATEDFIKSIGYAYPEENSRARKILTTRFATEYRKVCETAVKRYLGDWETNNPSYRQPSFVSKTATSIKIIPQTNINSRVSITLRDALNAWISDQFATKGDFSTTRKTTDEYAMNVERLIKLFGNIPVEDVSKQMITEFRDTLLRLPTNPRKEVKALSFAEQIQIADKEELHRLSIRTRLKNLKAIATILNFAKERLDAPIINEPVHASGILKSLKKVLSKIDSEEQDSASYSEDDLTLIFRGPAHHSNWVPPRSNFGKA